MKRFSVSRTMLGLVLSRDRASAVIGDLEEELSTRVVHGRPVRWPRMWMAAHLCAYVMAALFAAAPRSFRRDRQTVVDALRGLRSTPSTTAFAIFILTLGISAATVTFSVVDHVVLRRLPFDADHELVAVEGTNRHGLRDRRVDETDYRAWRDRTDAFDALAMWHPPTFVTLRSGEATERIATIAVTSSLFDVLRVTPLVGRAFEPEHHTAGHDRVVLISHRLWQSRFGGAPDVVGRSLDTTGGPLVIVGVMPRTFMFPLEAAAPIDVWRPHVSRMSEETLEGRRGRSTDAAVIGRLRDEVTVAGARAQVERVTAELARENPAAYDRWTARLTPLRESLVGDVQPWMLLLLASVGLVMVVACVNVANLLLARATHRSRDLAVRAALGAGRRHLVGVLVLESLLLSSAAAVLGVLAATWGLDVARAALPAGIARVDAIALDARVLAFTVAASLATGLLFGLVPAWQATRSDLVESLKDGGVGAGGPARPLWSQALLVGEVAFVVLLLIVTGLFVSSFARVTGMDLGFERANLIGARPQLSQAGVPPAERELRENAIVDQALEAVRVLPGVDRVSLSAGADLPFGFVWNLRIEAADLTGAVTSAEVDLRGISADYFDTANIRIVRGRTFDERDRVGQPLAAIIDDLTARRLFGDRNPLDQVVRFGRSASVIVGVVGNVRLLGPEGRLTGQLYYALSQSPKQGQRQLIVRTRGRADQMVGPIAAAIATVVPAGSRPAQVILLEDRFRALTADRRFNAGLMSIFGALALLIGAAGVYSVMASLVSQQTRDIGVRLALGATRADIVGLVIGRATRQIALGAVIGLAAAWAWSGVFTALLFEITSTDAVVYAVATGVVVVAGLAAAFIPARRAATVDPLHTIRQV